MNSLDFIINNQFLIFPEFYTVKDLEGNEYVFIRTDDDEISSIKSVKDKTQLEAYENHIHIFDKLKRQYYKSGKEVAHLITNNLIKRLRENFPNKKFHVYLACDLKDHTIIRFHQHWDDEIPYYDVKEFTTITEYTVGF